MTPFALLEKSANQLIPRLLSMVSRGSKGFGQGIGDVISVLRGGKMTPMATVGRELGRAGQLGSLAAAGSIAAIPYGLYSKFAPKSQEYSNTLSGLANGGHRLGPGAAHPSAQMIWNAQAMSNGSGATPGRDLLPQPARVFVEGVKKHPIASEMIPSLNSLPSGFQQNQLLRTLAGW